MRVFIRSIVLSTMLAVAVQSQVALAEETSFLQKFQQVTSTVKQTVVGWWNKYVAPAATDAPAAAEKVPARDIASSGSPAASVSNEDPSKVVPTPQSPSVTAPSASPVEEIKAARRELKAQPTFAVKTQGRESQSKLKSKAGVARYDFAKLQKVKAIPLIDVGLEPEISRKNFALPAWDWKTKQFEGFQKLPSPSPISGSDSLALGINKAGPIKWNPSDKQALDAQVTKEKIDKIDYKIDEVGQIDLKPFEPMSEDQVKMLVMRILFEKGKKCHVVMGFADDLSRKPEFKDEANFAVGSCAKEFKMNNVAFTRLSGLIKKQDPSFGPKSLAIISQNLPISDESAFYELVKDVNGKPEYFADKKANNEIYYRAGKGAFRAGHYNAAEKYAAMVDPSSTFGPYAQFLLGISQYTSKEKAAGRATLEKLAASIESSSDTNLRGLVAVNLARMNFTAQKYDASLAHFMKVPKDHPLWVHALIDQGWAQLAVNDPAGAIGNMYSLHSPYFKVLYQPQSFVVRTVGYLNICQYGDAYRTLTKLESDYRDWQAKLNKYMGTSANAYETAKTYLRSKSNTDIEGLPYQIVREGARGKEFLNIQNAINDKADETGLFASVIDKLRKDKEGVRLRAEQAKKRAEGYAARIAAAKVAKAPLEEIDKLKRNMELERSRSVPNQYELSILNQSQKAFHRFEASSRAVIAEGQRKLAGHAATVLKARFKSMQTEIARILENNEFLRYEIFAGSGENIRYQVAGGQTGGEHRLPASVKPQKMMNWSFDGEFWEDEIGNYRSSLKNNCPKTAQGN